MVTDTEIAAIVSVCGFVASVGTSAFMAGSRWGRVEQKMKDIESTVDTKMSDQNARLAKIEGMFTLKLKDF